MTQQLRKRERKNLLINLNNLNYFSNHVLNRWVFPIVPETNLHQNDDYRFLRGNIYKASDVILSRLVT